MSLMQKKSFASSKKNSTQKNKLYAQDLIGIKEIYKGLVFLENGQCIDIIEALPINYDQKSFDTKETILSIFADIQRILPDTVHFKLRNEVPSIGHLINNLQERSKLIYDINITKQAEDQAAIIKNMQSTFVKRKRYYIIHHYAGKSRDKEEIVESMYEERASISRSFYDMGHAVVSPNFNAINEQVVEMLYRHFNPKSSIEQSFRSRIFRLMIDEDKYNRHHSDQRYFDDCDYIAPRGIRLVNSDAVVMDGVYHTYLTLQDDSYPPQTTIPGFVDVLLSSISGLDYDVDVYSARHNHAVTVSLLKQTAKMSYSTANAKANDPRANPIVMKAKAQKYMLDAMEKEDQDCFDCLTTITIRAASYQELQKAKRSVIKKFKQSSIYLEEADGNVMDYLKMTMPFMHIKKDIFTKNKRNFLSESMPAFYWYTTSELSDDSGIVLGINELNYSVASTNFFNSNYHVNPHISIVGTSGAGKTFFQQMLGRRLFLSGLKCMFIIPAKGYEYRDGCLSLGGSYIKVGPGIDTCINVMEIRAAALSSGESLLANKITTLTVLMTLLIKTELDTFELSRFPVAVKNVYAKFGITDDNESIFLADGSVKKMPILSDLYNELKNDSKLERLADALLPLIYGQYSNMNGHTNVDLDNDYIVFDVEERIIGKQLFPAFMFLVFDLCKDIGMYDRNKKAMLFLDEVWKMLINAYCADQIKEHIKLLRGYGTGVCIATQDIADFMNSCGDTGKSLLSNCDTMISLRLKETEMLLLKDVIKLNDAEKSRVLSFKIGEIMFMSDNNKTPIFTSASPLERYIYEPRDDKRREILESTGLVLSDYLTAELIKKIHQAKAVLNEA